MDDAVSSSGFLMPQIEGEFLIDLNSLKQYRDYAIEAISNIYHCVYLSGLCSIKSLQCELLLSTLTITEK